MTTAVYSFCPAAAPAKAGNIVAVASGKGGVGKTWLAITLAHALARLGRRTLLFDGDLGLANVDIQLGLMPEHDLGGVLAGRLSLARRRCGSRRAASTSSRAVRDAAVSLEHYQRG